MKAAVFHSPGNITYTIEDPTIEDSNDIILKVTSTAICEVICICIQEDFPKSRTTIR